MVQACTGLESDVDYTPSWLAVGSIQLAGIGIIAALNIYWFRSVVPGATYFVRKPVVMISSVAALVAGMTILLNFILGPLWLSDVDRWSFSILTSASAGLAYGMLRMANRKLLYALKLTLEDMKTAIKAQQ